METISVMWRTVRPAPCYPLNPAPNVRLALISPLKAAAVAGLLFSNSQKVKLIATKIGWISTIMRMENF
jgi:hypothetical protein